MGKPLVDMIGDRYGSLSVIGRAENYRGNAQWLCKCDCGKIKTYIGFDLRKGKLRSCGCKNPSAASDHGMAGSPTYFSWQAMRNRCNNKSARVYKYYGARGITVCERWNGPNDFPNFLADMGPRPDGKSLERIDNDGVYSPSNCRWATQKEQMNNRRANRYIVLDGRRQTLSQWLTEFNLKSTVFQDRTSRGWTVERAIKTPLRELRKKQK